MGEGLLGIAQLPWNQTKYLRYYYFHRRRMAWLIVIVVFLLICAWWFVPHYIVDPAYVAEWDPPRCRGRRCGYYYVIAFAIFLFLLLPVWIKASASVMFLGELISRLFVYVIWSFDKRPDFAIGPYGIYGIDKLKYRHVPWRKIFLVQDGRNVTRFGSSRWLSFHSNQKREKRWWLPGVEPSNIKITLLPIHGFDILDILAHVKTFAPQVKIEEKIYCDR